MPRSHAHKSRRGLTLTELVVVLAILAALGSLLLPAVGHFVNDSRSDVTRASLARLRDVIGLYWNDNQQLPQPNPRISPSRIDAPQVRYLFVNPATEDATVTFNPVYKLGWRGPYVVANNGSVYTINAAGFSEQYGETGDPAVLDGWGNPIVIQNPLTSLPGGLLPDGSLDVRLVSAGPNGIVHIDPTVSTAALLNGSSPVGDDVWISFELR
jgi:prepilin-type N-terminal cleavage/methylation domain-containing protein